MYDGTAADSQEWANWHTETLEVRSQDGSFVRSDTQFRDQITIDSGSGSKAEKERYHLYILLGCLWAHRTLIYPRFKDLEDVSSISGVEPLMADGGSIVDPLFCAGHMHAIYTQAWNDYSGWVMVPVLWDCERATTVNNKSAEIIRMFNSEFAALAPETLDYCPVKLQVKIDAVSERAYNHINNGVYRNGFAATQQAFDRFFAALDCVYCGHFKSNFRHIKEHYYRSHESINPPRNMLHGPEMTLTQPHDGVRL